MVAFKNKVVQCWCVVVLGFVAACSDTCFSRMRLDLLCYAFTPNTFVFLGRCSG